MILKYIIFCRRRPLLLFCIFASLILISALRFPHTRISAFSGSPPRAFLIRAEYPSAHPEKVERKITEPLEEAIYGAHGIAEMESYSEEGRSEIRIFLNDESDIRKSEMEIRERAENAFRKFPSDARYPSIENFRRENSPDLILKVEKVTESDEEKQFAETVLKPEILKEKTVSGISIYGGYGREFLISLIPEKLRKYSVSPEAVLSSVRKSRVQRMISRIFYNDKIHKVILKSSADSEEQISQIPVIKHGGSTVFLKDLSEVHYVQTRPTSIFRRNGKEETAVYIHFSDQSGYQHIRKILSEEKFIGKTSILYDRSEEEKKEWAAAFSPVCILSSVLLFLQVRKGRNGILGIISSLLTFFIFISFSEKFTLPDFYSAGAGIFILSLGIRWDKISVLVLLFSSVGFLFSGFLENFSFPKIQMILCLKLYVSASIYLLLSVCIRIFCRTSGLKEIFFRLKTLSKVTNFIINYTVLSSALLMNSLCKFWKEKKSKVPDFVFFSGAVAAFFLLLTADVLYLQTKISFAFPERTSAVTANLELPSGFSLSASERAAAVLEKKLLKLPGIETFSLSENDHSSVTVRSAEKIDSRTDWIRHLKEIAGKTDPAYLHFQTEEGRSPEEELTFDVYGNDFIQMHDYISHLVQYAGTLNGTIEAVYRYKPARDELLFYTDRAKLSSLNIPESGPGETLRLYMEGSVIGKVFLKGKNRDLRIELNRTDREEFKDFMNLPVFSRDGSFAESGTLLSPEQSSVPVRIQHRNKGRVLSFSVRLNREGENDREEIIGKILSRKPSKQFRMELRERKEKNFIIKLRKMHSERTLIFLFFGTVFSICLHQKRIFLLGLIFRALNFRTVLNTDRIAENFVYIKVFMEMTVSIISFSAAPGFYFILERFLPAGTVLEILHLFIASAFLLKLNSAISQKYQCGNLQIESEKNLQKNKDWKLLTLVNQFTKWRVYVEKKSHS